MENEYNIFFILFSTSNLFLLLEHNLDFSNDLFLQWLKELLACLEKKTLLIAKSDYNLNGLFAYFSWQSTIRWSFITFYVNTLLKITADFVSKEFSLCILRFNWDIFQIFVSSIHGISTNFYDRGWHQNKTVVSTVKSNTYCVSILFSTIRWLDWL